MSFDPTTLARAEIRSLKPYEHALWDPALIRLHANEAPWRPLADVSVVGLNRYPEPQPRALCARLAEVYGTTPDRLLVGRGSDEAIDLLTRAFCRAGEDAVLVCPPTFGMYAVAARIQGARVLEVPLLPDRGFALDMPRIEAALDASVKLIWLCSPNNPTGNLLDRGQVQQVIAAATGRALVAIDEAYIEFAPGHSCIEALPTAPHVAVLRTLSKAYGLAGARVGALVADPRIVALLRRIIPPYAMPQLSVEAALAVLDPALRSAAEARQADLVRARDALAQSLAALPTVVRVWPSAANFLLVEFNDADVAFRSLLGAGLLVRDVRSHVQLGRALRITVGSADQNQRVVASLA